MVHRRLHGRRGWPILERCTSETIALALIFARKDLVHPRVWDNRTWIECKDVLAGRHIYRLTETTRIYRHRALST